MYVQRNKEEFCSATFFFVAAAAAGAIGNYRCLLTDHCTYSIIAFLTLVAYFEKSSKFIRFSVVTILRFFQISKLLLIQ